jgi:Ohr subfamily peroxiredoxin
MNVLYTATALATGDGRNGHARSDDGLLDLDMRIPKEMGGAGGAANPEMLFAMGYAACFHSALKVVASQDKLNVNGSEVSASVGIGQLDNGGFGLTVALAVHTPNLDQATAEALVAKAHEVCPYSNATRGNITVDLSVV